MITVKGASLLAIAILVYLLGRLTQVGWLYLLDAVLWGMVLTSALLPWLGVAFLRVRRRLEYPGASPHALDTMNMQGASGPSEGDTVKINLSLSGGGFWPRFFLTLQYHCPLAGPAQRKQKLFVARLPAGGVTLTTTLSAYQRGLHQLGPVQGESAGPFGLFRRRVRLTPVQPVLVYPQVPKLRRLALVDELSQAAALSRRSRVGVDTVGSRPYVPGDPRRHIHWRNTARAGRPMVRELEDPQDQSLHLFFDATQVWGEDRDTTLEYAIKIIAGVAAYARRQGVPVQVWGGARFPQGNPLAAQDPAGGASWPRLLHNLAPAAPGDGPSLSHSLSWMPSGGNALVVVSAGDLPGLQALGTAAPSLRRLSVVLLEGFGEAVPASGGFLETKTETETETETPATSVAHPRGLLVRCRPGRLLEALHGLEQDGEGSLGAPVPGAGQPAEVTEVTRALCFAPPPTGAGYAWR